MSNLRAQSASRVALKAFVGGTLGCAVGALSVVAIMRYGFGIETPRDVGDKARSLFGQNFPKRQPSIESSSEPVAKSVEGDDMTPREFDIFNADWWFAKKNDDADASAKKKPD